jgi:hypothetical protein
MSISVSSKSIKDKAVRQSIGLTRQDWFRQQLTWFLEVMELDRSRRSSFINDIHETK